MFFCVKSALNSHIQCASLWYVLLEEIVDAPGNDGNGSMPEQVKRPNSRRKKMIMMMVCSSVSF